MIPRAHITHWRGSVPWADDAQVEQDLVLSRAVVEIFGDEAIAKRVVLRGGTALHKLLISPPVRYSEDIDLVQRDPGPIGEILDGLRDHLDRWLGKSRRERGPGSARIAYRFDSETMPIRPLRLKIEINTREHFAVLPIQSRRLVVDSPWFRGEAEVAVYHCDELLGTKLRALYQRKKGRDLFDLWFALDRGLLDPEAVVTRFRRYMDHGGTPVSRAEFEANLAEKASDPAFRSDIRPLLARGVDYDADVALDRVRRDLVSILPGGAWKGSETPGP